MFVDIKKCDYSSYNANKCIKMCRFNIFWFIHDNFFIFLTLSHSQRQSQFGLKASWVDSTIKSKSTAGTTLIFIIIKSTDSRFFSSLKKPSVGVSLQLMLTTTRCKSQTAYFKADYSHLFCQKLDNFVWDFMNLDIFGWWNDLLEKLSLAPCGSFSGFVSNEELWSSAWQIAHSDSDPHLGEIFSCLKYNYIHHAT